MPWKMLKTQLALLLSLLILGVASGGSNGISEISAVQEPLNIIDPLGVGGNVPVPTPDIRTTNSEINAEEALNVAQDGQVKATQGTELTEDPVQALLLISTLDGSLTAVNRQTGEVRWVAKDEPMIRVPTGNKVDPYPKPPFFLPDPRSGALYVLGRHSQLKKLPFTIPKLVQMAPCKSTEGLLYSGKKMDTWIALDPVTGYKRDIKCMESSTCPTESNDEHSNPRNVLIGKTEYTISMLDGARKWNVTFQDYSSMEMSQQSKQDYDLVHFTSPSSGSLLTYDRPSGELLWQSNLDSPVVGLYSIDCALSSLISLPFTALATETLDRLKTVEVAQDNSQLVPTLYIGECPTGLYAVPSLVDDTYNTISSSNPKLPLLEGPHEIRNEEEKLKNNNQQTKEDGDYLLLGHYELPENPVPPLQQIEGDKNSLPANKDPAQPRQPANESKSDRIIAPIYPSGMFGKTPRDPNSSPNTFPLPVFPKVEPAKEQKSTILVIIISTAIGCATSWVLFKLRKKYNSPRKVSSSISEDGVVYVGKISFDPSQVLGQGCEGTFVFKGRFENRAVAVKRVIPECFAFADREVDLLKESDEHPNVVRYFCTEQDLQFRYIALELCDATLSDWIEGKFSHNSIDPIQILREATDGLAHLHSLRIVHRDIKPANVLLCVGGSKANVKAMISDFGLCKKLPQGRASFSRRSGGVPGTEGWIAPELLNVHVADHRATNAVDIFSLGCVFYYVLTNGRHPFGEPYHRQANIIHNKADLSHLNDIDDMGERNLIELMISAEAERRPQPSSVLLHPLFWQKEKILSFFLDVSDRIEKGNENTCPLLMALENDESKLEVVRNDWRNHICPEVALDLRKYRTYKGDSVRDLLRALRNKKNHYRELTPEAQASLGEIPNKFVSYWLTRFPLLLQYTWSKCEIVKTESVFAKYYCPSFNFYTMTDLRALEADVSDCLPTNAPSPSNSLNNSPQKQKILTKNFWKSKNAQNNRFRRRGGGAAVPALSLRSQLAVPGGRDAVFVDSAGPDSDNWRSPN